MSITTNFFSDEELRAVCLNHAVKLLDNDFHKARNECNTTTMLALVTELFNIVRHGSVTVPEAVKAQEVLPPSPTAPVFA